MIKERLNIIYNKNIQIPAIIAFLLCACISSPALSQTEKIISGDIAPLANTNKQKIISKSSITSSQTLHTAQAEPQQRQSASLSFSWNIPVNLSVFHRDRYLWIIFDHSQNVNTEEMQILAQDLTDEIIQIPHNYATIVRVSLKQDVKSHVRREGLLWVIDLFRGKHQPKFKELPIFTQYDGQKNAYLFIPTTAAGEIVHSIDPVVGDHLTIATLSDIDTGIKSSYQYPEFELLQSEQGIAIVQNAPDIVVSRGNTGITIRALNRSLYISENLDQIKRQLRLADAKNKNMFNLYVPVDLINTSYTKAIEQLNQDIIKAEGTEQKNSAQIELIKYYLAKGLGSEALTQINNLVKNNETLANSEKIHGLRGVANFLLHRYKEATEDFSFGHLPETNEAIFWRTLSSSAYNFQKEDAATIFSFMSLIKDYPQELKERIALVAADTSIKAGNDIAAQNFIDIIIANKNPIIDRTPQIHYLLAQKYITQGYSRNALLEYHKASLSNSSRFSSLSRYEEALLAESIGAIKPHQAIEELEKLRMAWKEDPFTLNLLISLSKLYVKNQDYYNALRTLNEARPLADKKYQKIITTNMIQLFEDIYYHNQDNDIPAIKSLALYQDFQWLSQKSKYHNQMIQKLADRLVAVDLMPRAAFLLLNHLKSPDLSPQEKGAIATRLALIRLFENNASEAIKTLDETEDLPLSITLKSHRKIIRAKAYTIMGLEDEALDLLADDTSKNSILIKSEILWNANRWGEASDTIKYLITPPKKDEPLSLEQISYILDWATALKKSGKETVLIRLRNKFYPYFKNTKYESAFNVLTNHLDEDTVDIDAINQAINEVAAFSNFAKIYSETIKNTSLSETIK